MDYALTQAVPAWRDITASKRLKVSRFWMLSCGEKKKKKIRKVKCFETQNNSSHEAASTFRKMEPRGGRAD